ncbi:MAG: hypothetical protein Q7W45_04385 [Bacteroidota bacterium]|nr:hypothetical protein [Bacteroidota bacterium]MDP3144686.1 hypothetical protein [Bacteroidota bacterium]MDP3557022.1 hypothetical protein [Bacteroidota bacterium]
MFGLIVTSYVISSVGIPIYLHYCGGELENINYVIKGSTCCGEEEDSEMMNDDCCKDENLIVKNSPDFTLKQLNNYTLVKSFCQVFYTAAPFFEYNFKSNSDFNLQSIEAPPPKLQASLVISTSVLRI